MELDDVHWNSKYKKYSGIPRIIHLWNILPTQATQCPREGAFNRELKPILQKYD